jgi:allantoin racemase
MERTLHVPVIDPVVAAVKMAESVIDTGKRTSKIKTFRPPEKKVIKGYPEIMQP